MCAMFRAQEPTLRKAVTMMNNKFLRISATAGQLLAVLPFAVLCEGVGFDVYIWWHYLAIYAVFGAFYGIGRLCGAWAVSPRHSRSFRPKAIFLSKAALTLPILVFFIVCMALELSTGLYIYVLPAAIIMFHGGYSTVNKEYTDIFGRGWFALYFVAAVIVSVILWFTHDKQLMDIGNFQLCLGFGLLIILSAVLTNQTNIDSCTHQRDSNKMSLPKGLRGYNTKLVAAVTAVTVALFLFTKPLATLLITGMKQLIRGFMWLMTRNGEFEPTDDLVFGGEGEGNLTVGEADNSFAEATTILIVLALLAIVFVFRKQLAEFFREIFAPLFRLQEPTETLAYTDEVTELPEAYRAPLSRRKREQQLYRQFRKETDSVKKYRIGYKLMLLRLQDTPFATVPTDNTDIHRVKGENGLRNERVQQIVSIYNDVRYKGRVPSAEEMALAEAFIEEIRR